MKYIITIILFLLISIHSFAQSKNELINAIIRINSLDGYDGIDYYEGHTLTNEKNDISKNNYYNFEKLKKKLSQEELITLTNHENDVLRLYAIRELIYQGDHKIDIKSIILEEINNNSKILTHEGCIESEDLIYSVIYHDYWNQIQIDAIEKNDEKTKDSLRVNALQNDSLLKEINTAIIKLDKDINWLVYERIFSTIRYNPELNKEIVKLIYSNNNFYAFKYMSLHFPLEFKEVQQLYFISSFPRQYFKNENQSFYLYGFTKYAFEHDNQVMKHIILKKLKRTKSWKRHLGGTFEHQIFRKYNVKV